MKKYIAIVPFRSKSVGLPNKNLKYLDGKPLWKRAMLQALRTCDNTILSSDIKSISTQDLSKGHIFDFRPPELANDDSLMSDVILYLINKYSLEDNHLVLLQPTSPLRSDENIKNAIKKYEMNNYDMVFSITKKDPSTLKYGTLENDEFIPLKDAKYCFQNRQDLPEVYAPNGAIYVFSASSFLIDRNFPLNNIGTIVMNKELSLDIDNFDDLTAAKRYLLDL